jgi:integrase
VSESRQCRVLDEDAPSPAQVRLTSTSVARSFLFWSAWRVGEVRTLQWRDYDRTEQTLRLRPEHSKWSRAE